VNLLCWVGYEEPEFISDFEKETGIRVNTKTFIGGDQMYSLLSQSTGEYDVVVMDPEYISKLHRDKKITVLNRQDYNFRDYFPYFADFPLATIDGQLYGVVVRYGSGGLLYNSDHITADEASSYDIIFDPRLKGKVGIWDWYLPCMGCFSRAVGNNEPYDIDDVELQKVKDFLARLRPQVAAIYPTPAEMTNALANGDVWIVPCVGEWISVGLQKNGVPVSWSVPKEGGVMWVETLGIPVGAPNSQNAVKLIQWMQKPEVQAKLTQRKAYQSHAVNRKAYDLLSAKEKDFLRVQNEADATSLISRLSVRYLPKRQSEKEWQTIWEEFKGK
jgi:spermidine/putrescine transport system substrate-binding protein